MTNELKVDNMSADQIALALQMIDVSQVGEVYRDLAVDLIKFQQSRIELLESVIRDAAEYHRGYVEKLKESDPDRSARQQDRVNYFMDILEQAK